MQSYICTGNLTRNPEIKIFQSKGKDVKVANFTIASSRRFKKADGTSDQEVLYLDAEAWDSGAETIVKYFTKGSPILVEGSLRNENWKDKEGNPRSKIKLRVNRFEFFSVKKKDGEGEAEHTDVPADEPEGADIPF